MDWSNLDLLDYPYMILRNIMFKVSIKYDSAGFEETFWVFQMFSPPQKNYRALIIKLSI